MATGNHLPLHNLFGRAMSIQSGVERAQVTLQKREHARNQAITAFEKARRHLIAEAIASHGYNFCAYGPIMNRGHLAPSDGMMGVLVQGAYVTSGYSEYLRNHTSDPYNLCAEHLASVKPGVTLGRYEGEYSRLSLTHPVPLNELLNSNVEKILKEALRLNLITDPPPQIIQPRPGQTGSSKYHYILHHTEGEMS